MRALMLVMALALPAAASAQQGPATKAGFIAAMARAGCGMSQAEAPQRLAAEGFPQAFVRETATEMFFSGEAEMVSRDRLQLLPNVCPPVGQAAATPRDIVLHEIAARDCGIAEAEAREVFQEQGFTDAQLLAILGPLHANGAATVESDRLILTDEVCPPQG